MFNSSSMIALDSISLRYGHKILYNEISGYIGSRDRIALVGSNGAGKTTLFKVILGLQEVDGGKVEKAGYVSIGYLPQDGIEVSGKSLYDEVESAFEDILTVQKKLDEANTRLHELDTTTEEYYETLELIGGFEHKLQDMEASKLRSKIEKVLMGLGFAITDLGRDCGEFSGGWQMRIALAKLLLREPTLLLLDEPTNHLDLPSQRWVERYLKQYEGSILLISHDRSFLDILCNRSFHLTMGKLDVYEGNYSFYEKESVQRKALLINAYKNQQKQIEDQQRFIDRFRSKSSKAKQVQSRIKMLDRIERIEVEKEESTIGFKFPEAPPSGRMVLELKNLTKYYGEKRVFENLNFKLERGDRVAVVGVNGAGKSTLAKVLAGVEPLTAGEHIIGHKVQLAYFAQQQTDAMDLDRTVLETVEAAAVSSELSKRARTLLGSFLFRGDDVFKKVRVLSGGEKCRLALASMLVQRANCLILDEPTNHLDMRSQEMLQKALAEYDGTLFIISHNRSFLDPVVTKVLEVSPNGVRMFYGNVSSYIEKTEAEEAAKGSSEPQSKSVALDDKYSAKEKRKAKAQAREALKPLRDKLAVTEKEIEELEAAKTKAEELMRNPEFFSRGEKTQSEMKIYHEMEARLKKALDNWAEITEKIEKAIAEIDS